MAQRPRRTFVAGVIVMVAVLLSTVHAQTVISFARLSSQAHNAYLEPLIAAFEAANPDVVIENVESAGDGYEGLAQTALLGLAAGTPPDLVQVGFTLLPTLVASGGPIALDPFMEASGFDKSSLMPGMLELGQLGGSNYIMPIGVSTPVMYYNLDLFRAAGLDPESPPTTWDEAREAAQALVDAGYQGILWGWSITGNWLFQTMLESAGGRMGMDTEAGHVATFDDEAGEQVLSYLQGLAQDGLMPVTEATVQTFASGQLGMLVDSSFQRVNTPRQVNAEVRLAPVPIPAGGEVRLPAGGNGVMMFSRDPAKQEAAWRFLEFLAGPEGGRIVAENTGYTPGNAALLETLAQENAGDPDYVLVLQQVANVVPWHAWPSNNGTRISQVIKDMQLEVLLGRATPSEALERAAAETNQLLAE
ncbi:MAG TPA: ABC transporter substrate-binding protein [Trueperaceae bacterium]